MRIKIRKVLTLTSALCSSCAAHTLLNKCHKLTPRIKSQSAPETAGMPTLAPIAAKSSFLMLYDMFTEKNCGS